MFPIVQSLLFRQSQMQECVVLAPSFPAHAFGIGNPDIYQRDARTHDTAAAEVLRKIVRTFKLPADPDKGQPTDEVHVFGRKWEAPLRHFRMNAHGGAAFFARPISSTKTPDSETALFVLAQSPGEHFDTSHFVPISVLAATYFKDPEDGNLYLAIRRAVHRVTATQPHQGLGDMTWQDYENAPDQFGFFRWLYVTDKALCQMLSDQPMHTEAFAAEAHGMSYTDMQRLYDALKHRKVDELQAATQFKPVHAIG